MFKIIKKKKRLTHWRCLIKVLTFEPWLGSITIYTEHEKAIDTCVVSHVRDKEWEEIIILFVPEVNWEKEHRWEEIRDSLILGVGGVTWDSRHKHTIIIMWRRIVSSGLKTLASDVAAASPRRSIATTVRPVGFYRSANPASSSLIPRHFSSESGDKSLFFYFRSQL